jgi:ABC-type multidrug transport system fused ATPase/permease subunit
VKDTLLPVLTSVVSVGAMLAVLWRIHPQLTIVALAVVPWMAFVVHRYLEPVVERSYEAQQAEGRLYDIVEQTMYSIPVVQAFGREPDADQRFARAADEMIQTSLAESIVGLKLKVLVGVATTMATAAIVWLGVSTVRGGGRTAGPIIVLLAYLGSLYGPLESIMS